MPDHLRDNENLINYRCKISGNRVLDIQLPTKLSSLDVERLTAFLESQADDDYEAKVEPLIPLTGWNMDDIGRITAALALPSNTTGSTVASAVRQLTRRCEELEHKLIAYQDAHKA